jgi:monothiol glutaredoxin
MSQEFDKEETINAIKELLAETPVILFMKGSPEQPQCGFSAKAVQIMKACGHPFAYIDILEHPAVRATLKEVTEWPTFPQLIVEGELIGGSDIMEELFEEGELQEILDNAATHEIIQSANDDGYESESENK